MLLDEKLRRIATLKHEREKLAAEITNLSDQIHAELSAAKGQRKRTPKPKQLELISKAS